MADQSADKLRAFLESRKKQKSSEGLQYTSHQGGQKVEAWPDTEEKKDLHLTPSVEEKPESSKPDTYTEQPKPIQTVVEKIEQPTIEEDLAPVETAAKVEEVKHPEQVKADTKVDKMVGSASEVKAEESVSQQDDTMLKAYLNQRRKTIKGDDLDEDDPYSGDGIAKKNLRHLQKYLEREDIADIKEIIINRPCEVGIEHASGEWEWVKDPDLTQGTLDEIARTLANKSGQLFHPGNPILSVKMPGGHRVQVVAGFNAPSGFVFSMRLQRKEKFGLMDFKMPDEEREAIKEIVRSQKTILISGGTGTGKTSFMNALIPSIPEHERLVTMEDVPELRIPHRNWAQLIFSGSDTAMGDQGVIELLNACLRLRPDRIILGEIRKENAFAFCSAINTGHEGSMATIHANSPKMALDAVINRVMMNGDLPDSAMQVLRRQLIHDIYAVVQLTRIQKGVEAKLCILNDEEDI